MADGIDNLEGRLVRVEDKIDGITASIAKLSASIDRGFHGVDEAIDDQRKFVEFSFTRLETKVDAGFTRVDANAVRLEKKLDEGFARMDTGFGRVGRIERKLDQFIDAQVKTNKLVGRRLQRGPRSKS